MRQSFVTFFSPGTMVAETTTTPIDKWDINKAISMAKEVKERHGALPYGFQFTIRERADKELDSKETVRSGMYYLGGKISTLDEIKKKNDPKDRILISNMECNGYDRIVTNNNSWKWTQPLGENDTVLLHGITS